MEGWIVEWATLKTESVSWNISHLILAEHAKEDTEVFYWVSKVSASGEELDEDKIEEQNNFPVSEKGLSIQIRRLCLPDDEQEK